MKTEGRNRRKRKKKNKTMRGRCCTVPSLADPVLWYNETYGKEQKTMN
jgi:hypothetical protein